MMITGGFGVLCVLMKIQMRYRLSFLHPHVSLVSFTQPYKPDNHRDRTQHVFLAEWTASC
jgi:hypothetical protein